MFLRECTKSLEMLTVESLAKYTFLNYINLLSFILLLEVCPETCYCSLGCASDESDSVGDCHELPECSYDCICHQGADDRVHGRCGKFLSEDICHTTTQLTPTRGEVTVQTLNSFGSVLKTKFAFVDYHECVPKAHSYVVPVCWWIQLFSPSWDQGLGLLVDPGIMLYMTPNANRWKTKATNGWFT